MLWCGQSVYIEWISCEKSSMSFRTAKPCPKHNTHTHITHSLSYPLNTHLLVPYCYLWTTITISVYLHPSLSLSICPVTSKSDDLAPLTENECYVSSFWQNSQWTAFQFIAISFHITSPRQKGVQYVFILTLFLIWYLTCLLLYNHLFSCRSIFISHWGCLCI